MRTIAVIGAGGYVGSALCDAINRCPESSLVKIFRGDSLKDKVASADFVIHAANPARRFAAEQDPERDFLETVEKTNRILEECRGKELTLISSLSCRTQLHLSYGRNRRACEMLALGQSCGVVRLGPMFGGNRTQDVLHDILAGRRVYLARETRYAYVSVEWAAEWIIKNLGFRAGVLEIGARDSIKLGDLAFRFGSDSEFDGPDDTQEPKGFDDGPEVGSVFSFAEEELKKL